MLLLVALMHTVHARSFFSPFFILFAFHLIVVTYISLSRFNNQGAVARGATHRAASDHEAAGAPRHRVLTLKVLRHDDTTRGTRNSEEFRSAGGER